MTDKYIARITICGVWFDSIPGTMFQAQDAVNTAKVTFPRMNAQVLPYNSPAAVMNYSNYDLMSIIKVMPTEVTDHLTIVEDTKKDWAFTVPDALYQQAKAAVVSVIPEFKWTAADYGNGDAVFLKRGWGK